MSALPLSDSLARTRASYDATPYASYPLVRQQPARMAAAALWWGLDAPSVPKARVLEIGCASGGHIIPLAAAWPEARFLGVDLSPAQIAAGEARIVRLGLANIKLEARSLDEIGPADDAFDFIICHGVYSWIPQALREALLAVVAARLAPQGIAAISFNVLPGWRLFQIARDSLILHDRLQNNPPLRAENARQLFEALKSESNDSHAYGRFWRDDAGRMARGGDAYIAHEIFEDENAPVAFLDFCAALTSHGLAYLSECNVLANFEDSMAEAGAKRVRAFARGDDIAREQYIDIFSGRSFREALIIHAARASAIRREPEAGRLESLHFVPPLAFAATPSSGETPWRFGEGEGGVFVEDETAVRALRLLAERLPRSSRLEDLAPVAATAPASRERVAEALMRLVTFGHCAISTEPVVCATRLQEKPVASKLAASDAKVGFDTASLRHEPVRLEPLNRLAVMLLDGTRTRDDCVAYALGLAENGALEVSGPDGPVREREALVARLRPAIDRALESLLRLGFLVEAETGV